MNHIKMEYIKTIYNYQEYYPVIDHKPLPYYLDAYIQEGKCPGLQKFSSMLGLLPAWEGKLLWKGENDFIWELVDSDESLNVPILVCEDDCDLSCITILIKIRKTKSIVYWDKIGSANWKNWDEETAKRSGIALIEAYTEKEWEKYGDTIAWEPYGTKEFWDCVSKNWDEELLLRHRNYTKPFLQKDENVDWIVDLNWEFDALEYNHMVEEYRQLYLSQQEKK